MADIPEFADLRRKGIAVAQDASGKLWTDYNLHDPGVTLLEQYCFALTELGYRAEFPVADYLAEPDGTLDLPALGLHQPRDVLPTRPVTLNDLALKLTDACKDVRRVMIYPCEGENGCDQRGLYDIYVVPERTRPGQPCVKGAALEQVRNAFHANRNLCEDMSSLQLAKPIDCVLSAQIEVQRRHSPERVAGLIYECCGRLMTDGVRADTLDKVSRIEAFDNPEQLFGYNGSLPEGCKLLDHFFSALADIEEVKNVQKLEFFISGTKTNPFFERLNRGEYRQLSFPTKEEENDLTLRSRGMDMKYDLGGMLNELVRARSERRARRSIHVDNSEWRQTPLGKHREFDHIRVGETLPVAYRVGEHISRAGMSIEDRNAAAQLRGYLSFSDTPLSNESADFQGLRQLFSAELKQDKSYQSASFDFGEANTVALRADRRMDDIIAEFDPWRDRKGRALDHMLALYGQAFTQNSLRNHDVYRGPNERQDRILLNKLRILKEVHELDAARAGAADYMGSESCQRRGLGRKLTLLLGFRDRHNAAITSVLDRIDMQFSDAMSDDIQLMSRDELKAPSNIFDMLVPRRKVTPAIPHSSLIKETQALKANTVTEQFFRAAARLDAYVMQKRGDNWNIYLDLGDCGDLPLIASLGRRDDAIERANQVAGMFADLNEASEGFYLVEDILLRPRSEPGKSVYEPLTFHVVFSGWTARTMAPDFRELAEETISIICPAHLTYRVSWLNQAQTAKFQQLQFDWRVAFRNRDISRADQENADIERTSKAMREFLAGVETT